ncbi:MAG: 8-oxo-dGTP diphosphatase MutT, partial [Bacteroidota bacterium]
LAELVDEPGHGLLDAGGVGRERGGHLRVHQGLLRGIVGDRADHSVRGQVDGHQRRVDPGAPERVGQLGGGGEPPHDVVRRGGVGGEDGGVGEERAVVDGNVIRVMTRFYGIEEDIRRTTTRNQIQKIAQSIIPADRPGDFNQAVMELGATVCTPNSPSCNRCPLASECTAYRTASTDCIPWKSPAKRVPHHQIGVGILINDRNETLIALRPEDVMLGGLWEFPGGKQKKGESIEETVRRELKEELGIHIDSLEPFHKLNHAYSHFKITLHAWTCRIAPGSQSPTAKSSQEIRWVPLDSLESYPFPKANRTLVTRLTEASGNDKKKSSG